MGSFDYGHWPNPIVACFKCYKAFKDFPRVCPHCGGERHYMGTHFKAPKRSKTKEWQAIEMLYAAGVRFDVYDSHKNSWSNAYLAAGYGYNWSDFELWQVLAENGIGNKEQKDWRWTPQNYQFQGKRPTHPKDVPAYLERRNEKIIERITSVYQVCDRLNWSKPEVDAETLVKVDCCLKVRAENANLDVGAKSQIKGSAIFYIPDP